jgi:hypothetical protein
MLRYSCPQGNCGQPVAVDDWGPSKTSQFVLLQRPFLKPDKGPRKWEYLRDCQSFVLDLLGQLAQILA